MIRPCAIAIAALALSATGAGPSAQSRIVESAYLKASNAEAADHFGCGGVVQGHTGQGVAISADGTTLAIGAPHESSGAAGVGGNQRDNSVFDSGAVYVFTRSGSRWVQQAYVKASNPQGSAQFGHSVALSADGSTMAVSAHWESSSATGINGNQKDESIPQAGAVYVFTRRGTAWAQQAYIKASNTGHAGTADAFGDGDQFGFSIALNADGSTLAVGALTEDSGSAANQADNAAQSAGAVYVYARTGAAWTQQAFLKPANLDAGDLFGIAVALNADGSTLAVGSFDEGGSSRGINGAHDNRSRGSGAVYVFTRTGAVPAGGGPGGPPVWSQQAYIKASNGEAQDSFGVHLALSDDGHTLAVGSLDEDCKATGVDAPGCDRDTGDDLSMGAAYVFVRSGTASAGRGGPSGPPTWSQQAFLKASNTGFNDWFGARVAISGDGAVVAVAAPFEDSNAKGVDGNQADDSASEAGAVYVFARSGATWRQQSYLKGSNTKAFDEFGSALALDRTGTMLAVTARGEDGGGDEAGAGYVFALTK
jgi:tartrate dehydratase beta subunit/fumarate hydratase class I family protein